MCRLPSPRVHHCPTVGLREADPVSETQLMIAPSSAPLLSGALLIALTLPAVGDEPAARVTTLSDGPSGGDSKTEERHGTHPNLSVTPQYALKFEVSQSSDYLEKGGAATSGPGVSGKCAVLKGKSLIEIKDSSNLAQQPESFSLVTWINPYNTDRGQQMIAAKNRYSLNQREWGVMIDSDQKLRLYAHQSGWKTASCTAALRPGKWHMVGIVMGKDRAELWLDGRLCESIKLSRAIPSTDAAVTVGGVDDNGRIRQTFQGAIDELRIFDTALSPAQMKGLYTPVSTAHVIPDYALPKILWGPKQELPLARDIANIEDVSFHVIKKWDRDKDGYTFLHGVGLAWHEDKLFASIGHNKGAENTVTEEAQYRVSKDGGKSWGPLRVIDSGDEPSLAISHGVFASVDGTLWAFHGAYYNRMERIHTRAYSLDASTGRWTQHGVVVRDGFWPMNQPVRMADGNWIMPGLSGGRYSSDRVFPAAVAISHGDDMTQWDYVPIPVGEGIDRMWGESALWLDGSRVFNVARYGGGASALLASSSDFGREWTPSGISNLPMATSKPAAGTLSTGHHYLVCTTASGNGGRRAPLTIALTEPGSNVFSRVHVIRRALNAGHPGESAASLSLSYPCAVEYEGRLYVGFSNNGGRKGNLNSAELAIIPINKLVAN